MTAADATDVLLSLPRFAGVEDDAYAPGLDRVRALLDVMDRPHEQLRTVHVAGTNGKGSVASLIAAIATASGMRTGLHTSPHLHHLRERMRVDGTPAPEAWLAETVTRYQADLERIGPSFFEATVALSFRYFADRTVDLAVVEVGLGGRLDATNVLQPDLCVITNIDLDHTHLLGDTHAAIAREKAGIIKPDAPVLVGPVPDAAWEAIHTVAVARDALCISLPETVRWRVPHADQTKSILDLETPLRAYDRLRVPLVGTHQQMNAALAIRAAEAVVPNVTFEADPVYAGLEHLRRYSGLRGRLEVHVPDPLILADVAHNPSSLAATLQAVASHTTGDVVVGLALARDKDLDAIASILRDGATAVLPLVVDADRLYAADALADCLRAAEVPLRPPASVSDAVDDFRATALPDDVLLLTGSHRVLAALPPSD